MDGRITALRVGFLSSSHQLAGLNFPLPALLNTTQGLYPFIGVFAAFFKCWIGLAVWQVWLWSSGSLFFFIFFYPPQSACEASGKASRRRDGCRRSCRLFWARRVWVWFYVAVFLFLLVWRNSVSRQDGGLARTPLRTRVAPDRSAGCFVLGVFFFF